MKNLNPVKKKTSKDDRQVSFPDSSKQLAEFFHGVVINLDEEFMHD